MLRCVVVQYPACTELENFYPWTAIDDDNREVGIGVFENNEPAYLCYKKAGFVGTEIVQDEPWNSGVHIFCR